MTFSTMSPISSDCYTVNQQAWLAHLILVADALLVLHYMSQSPGRNIILYIIE